MRNRTPKLIHLRGRGHTEHTTDATLWVATCYRNDKRDSSMDKKEEARKKINFFLSRNRLNTVIYSVNKHNIYW